MVRKWICLWTVNKSGLKQTHNKQVYQWRTDACDRMASQDPRIKFHQIWVEMSIGQTLNHWWSNKKFPRYLWSKIRKSGPKFTKIFHGMLLTKAHKQPKFCRDWLKNVKNIRDQKFVLLEKVKIFTPFNILAPRGPPWPNVTGLGSGVHQPPPLYLQNFVPFWRPSEISAAKLCQILLPT